ncbi:MAG: NAD(P)H-binding protein [Nitrospinae bacterium]|nr:NAD(P)H-binding protein [Nitrospinota bacterium]
MEIFAGDMEDTITLDRAFKGVDRVFLLSSAEPAQARLQGNVVKAAAKAGVSLLVKQSAMGAGPNSPVALARWHWETEARRRSALKRWPRYCPA